jgi:hypothetical protein
MMRRGLIAFTFVLLGFLPSIAQESSIGTATPAASFAFLPITGQSNQYEYSDTLTTPKGIRRFTATLKLTSVTAREIRATIVINGEESRSLDFYVDETGELRPASVPELATEPRNKRRSRQQSEQAAALESFVSRISLTSRIGAHPAGATSFPVKITVPGASCPMSPTIVLKSTQPEALVADANDTTSVSSTQNRQLFLPLGLGIGAGFIGGAVGGTPGRIVGLSISVTSLVVSLARSRHSGPSPADVSLHIDGKVADSRLQTLSGDQEVIIRGKRTRTISDKWSLIAEPTVSAGL